jgi:hypothetical protein
MQLTNLNKTPMRGKTSYTFTLMAEGDNMKCHVILRYREFTLKVCKKENREVREGSTSRKDYQIAFIVQA